MSSRDGSRLRSLAEIALVFAVMIGVKAIADAFGLIGAGSIGMWSGIVIATLWMRRSGTTWGDLVGSAPSGRRQWLVTLGLALATVVTVIAFMALVLAPMTIRFGLETPSDSMDPYAYFLGRPGLFVVHLVTVVWIGAALGEELLMRGFVLNRLGDVFGRTTIGWSAALVVHAVLFGALHNSQGVPGVIGAGMAAVIFGVVYLIGKRRLLAVVLGHGLINTISMTAYFLSDSAIT